MLGPELVQSATQQATEQRYKEAAAAGIETPEQRLEREITTTMLGMRPQTPQVRQVEIAEGPDGKVTPGVSHIYMRSDDGSMIHLGTKRETAGGGRGEGKAAITSADTGVIDSYLYREFEPEIRAAIESTPGADVRDELAQLETDLLAGGINASKVFQYLTPDQRKQWARASAEYSKRIRETGDPQSLFAERMEKKEFNPQLTSEQRAFVNEQVANWNRNNPKKPPVVVTTANEYAIWQKLQQIQQQ